MPSVDLAMLIDEVEDLRKNVLTGKKKGVVNLAVNDAVKKAGRSQVTTIAQLENYLAPFAIRAEQDSEKEYMQKLEALQLRESLFLAAMSDEEVDNAFYENNKSLVLDAVKATPANRLLSFLDFAEVSAANLETGLASLSGLSQKAAEFKMLCLLQAYINNRQNANTFQGEGMIGKPAAYLASTMFVKPFASLFGYEPRTKEVKVTAAQHVQAELANNGLEAALNIANAKMTQGISLKFKEAIESLGVQYRSQMQPVANDSCLGASPVRSPSFS